MNQDRLAISEKKKREKKQEEIFLPDSVIVETLVMFERHAREIRAKIYKIKNYRLV